jgi:hypothetical protein
LLWYDAELARERRPGWARKGRERTERGPVIRNLDGTGFIFEAMSTVPTLWMDAAESTSSRTGPPGPSTTSHSGSIKCHQQLVVPLLPQSPLKFNQPRSPEYVSGYKSGTIEFFESQ